MKDNALTGDEYFNELREKYLGCMEEIKNRTRVIQGFIRKEWHAGYVPSTAECMALQFRKTLELIALASLVANREMYAEQRENFKKDWNADRIMTVLKKVNPKFYPEPSSPEPSTPDSIADYELKPLSVYLTKNDYKLLLDRCGDLLHASNPYDSNETDYKQFIDEAPAWLIKIMSLLNHHHIYPLDADLMFIVQMAEWGKPVSLTMFEVYDPEAPSEDAD